MSKVTQYNAYLLSDAYYHIYNRTNNKELMFKNDENKHYFLKKYANYLYPYLKTYAYCLLDNHFHLLVQVRNEQEIKQAIVERPLEKRKKLELNYLKIHEHHTNIQNTYHLTKEDITHKLIAKSFQDFFNAYTKAFNKKHNRNGNLFNRPFKRVSIQDDTHFTQLIYYIHNNPCHHKIRDNFKSYKWSSYHSLLSDKPTLLERNTVMNWFGKRKNFINFHNQKHNANQLQNLFIEI